MKQKYILAFDQGTTSTRAILFDKMGAVISSNSRSHQQIYPNPGWVSHNAAEIYFNIVETGKHTLESAGITKDQIAAIGITNQRETLVAWNKETGEPICDAVVWQCRRTSDICRKIAEDGFSKIIRQKTGLIIDPYFSATKIKWILENIPEAKILLNAGKLLVGTIDSFIIWKMTEGKKHVTDYSNASRTMLFNIHDLKWDNEMLDYFKIPIEILPEVVPSSSEIGIAEDFGAVITGVAGDQHAALFGQTCFTVGDVKNTYGTGCFILKNIGEKPIISANNLLTTIAWNIDGRTIYALEGSIFNAGAAIEWMINDMKLIDSVQEINDICNYTTDTDGVYFVPAFSGLGAPHWDMYARGAILGMSLHSNKNHIVRALMEAIAYQSKDVIDCMDKDSGIPMKRLRVDGGVCNSNFVMQFQSDILNIPVERPKNIETTALGAAYLAGITAKYWSGLNEIKDKNVIDSVFIPEMDNESRKNKYDKWLGAVERTKKWSL